MLHPIRKRGGWPTGHSPPRYIHRPPRDSQATAAAKGREIRMEDMIKRIVDMDRKAREITESARREKLESVEEIKERAAALRAEYLDRARRRVQINAETERTLFEQAWRRKAAAFERYDERLDALYKEKHDEWLNAIVTHVKEA